MKNKKLLFIACLLLIIAGCKKNEDITTSPPVTPPVTNPTPQNYTITEDFESGSKTAYADGTVSLITGQWDMNDALIGNLAADAKDGNKSVRLRTGSITMDFDINGLKLISFKHAKYGTDANSTLQLLMSVDGGATFVQVGNDFTDTS